MATASHITERELAEANSVTSHGDGHQFEIQLGHLCNNRCVFCSSGQLTQLKLARLIPLDPMIAAIEQARASGARRVTFLGGEPTLHKGFLAALKRTVELGFEEIVIFTNGVLLPQPGFIDKVVALGNFEWRISIQGANEDAHVAVTGRPDSFRRIVEGLKLLRARGQRVTANMCVNERSYRSLPEYPALVREYGIRQLHIDIVRPSSTGERSEEYLRDIMPRYSAMAPFMGEMLARFEREEPDFDISIGNLPFCILPEWAHRIQHGGEETITQSCDATALEVAVDKYRWHASLRRHVPECEKCAFRRQCTGIFSTYLEIHGEEEFKAIPLETLRAQGALSRHFVVLSDPWLSPLEAAARTAPPGGWSLVDWRRDPRTQRVDVHFRAPHGHPVMLQFLPPPVEDAVLVTDQYALRVNANADSAEDDLVRLLSWVEEQLTAIHGLQVVRRLELGAIASAHRRARLLALGRRRLGDLVQAVVDHAQFGAWQVQGRYEADEGWAVALHGPDAGELEIRFVIREQAGRPRISLDARPISNVTPGTARAVVQHVVQTIQPSPAATSLA